MIVARALGVTALDLFEPPRPRLGPPQAFSAGAASVLDDEDAAWLHRSGLLVRLLPVPSPPVRLGPVLRTHPDRDLGSGLTTGGLA